MLTPVRIIVCVTNDLSTDQRVHKVCMFLTNKGAHVMLVGRKLPGSLELDRPYKTRRLRLLFTKGPLFYGFFNLRLFFFLLFSKSDVIVSNDLDTLWACAKTKRLKKRTSLVYDMHEIFTEVPELAHSPIKKRIWERMERKNIKTASQHITVNHSIAQWYTNKYGIPMEVVRNMPPRFTHDAHVPPADIESEKKYLIIQGAGINVDRGNEELVRCLAFLPPQIQLLIIGNGDVIPYLRQLSIELNLQRRITFFTKMPFEKLIRYTRSAWLGITLDKNTNLNYTFSLPNKLFDFIQANCPVLASDLPEVSAVVKKYNVGIIARSHNPKELAEQIMELHTNIALYAQLKQNTIKAASELCWENEIPVLEKIYGPYLRAHL
ncbi:MAG: glycosyltransferase [Flavobacteriales bacterium]